MRYLTFLVLVLTGVVGATRESESMFRVRRRGGENKRHLEEDDDFFLTYSDDGKSKVLDPFILALFVTPSQLQGDAIPTLRMAMNKFLLAEFNAIYISQDMELESVGSEVISYESTSKAGVRMLQGEIGTETEMKVTLTFASEPSPSSKQLEKDIREIMANLTKFVGNLTSFQHNDWKDVYEAFRWELPTPSPTAAPVEQTDGVQEPEGEDGGGGTNDDEDKSAVGAITSTTIVAATLVALVAFLLVQRRSRRSGESEGPKGRDSLFTSVGNDLYSMDRSLESSRSPPLGMRSPAGMSSIEYSTSVDDSVPEDSVFSGIDYTPSKYPNVKSTKSLLSGFTNASAATIRVSNNVENQKSQRLQSIEAGAPLEGCDEEDAQEDDGGTPRLTVSDISNDSNTAGNVSKTSHTNETLNEEHNDRHDASSALQGAYDVEQQLESKSFLPVCYGTRAPVEPATSSHVLADLQDLANSRGQSARDPTPTAATTSGSIYSSLFSCSPTLPPFEQYNNEKAKNDLNGSIISAEKTTRMHKNDGTNERTPSQRSLKSTTVGMMSGQATRLIGGAYSVDGPDSLHNRRRSLSEDESTSRRNARPLQSGGSKSAPTTPNKNCYNTYRSMPMYKSDIRDDLSRPSTPGDDMAESQNLAGYENTGYGCYPFRLNILAPAAPGENSQILSRHHVKNVGTDGTSIYQTRAMNAIDASNGRRHAGNTGLDGTAMYQANTMNDPFDGSNGRRDLGNTGTDGTTLYQENAIHSTMNDPFDGSHGRRHVGNTGIDGTALYQENAMHPLEWSYKSADLQSIGESTLSENEGSAMPRQFLFGGKWDKNSSTKSPGRDPKTPVSQRSGKSAASGTTNASSQGSASRQLINDLVWLEKKIADVRQGSFSNDPPAVTTVDSLSYVSDDNAGFVSVSSSDESLEEPTVSTGQNESVVSSIVCRDCYAPPGKLHIVIHSTKDGPAVHTVKPGSSLEGHIFPGDLIISVDNVDTRSYTAEQVMKMMAATSKKERKITVLHFEEED